MAPKKNPKTKADNYSQKLLGKSALIGLILIALVISLIWILIALAHFFLNTDVNITTLIDEKSGQVFDNYKSTEILKGEKITGRFRASENNLGSLLVRFYNFYRISDDQIIFRLKEVNQAQWQYQGLYKVDQFQPDKYFPFGFPIIAESRNHQYQFEIESTIGTEGNAIGLSEKTPTMAASYKFSKDAIKQNKVALLIFLYKKCLYGLRYINPLGPVSIFGVSLYFLVIWRYPMKLAEFASKLTEAIVAASVLLYRRERILSKKLLQSDYVIKLTQKIEKYWRHQTLVCFIILFGIFGLAFVARLSFYWDANNFEDKLVVSQIGGQGDYDNIIRHAWCALDHHDLVTKYWSYMNDYPSLVRIYGFFFRYLGFINGINAATYFFIVLSALVSTVPFVMLSRLKRVSLGGLLASSTMAVNPLAIWLASGRSLDTVTSALFSLFVITYYFASKYQNLLLLLLLGLLGFVDVFSRGYMIFNDFPALILFGLLYIAIHGQFKKSVTFLHVSRKTLLYACIPILVFLACYIAWYTYYQRVFGVPWFFAPWQLFVDYNPINDIYVNPRYYQSNTYLFHNHSLHIVIRYFVLFFLSIKQSIGLLGVGQIVLMLLVVTLFVAIWQKNKRLLYACFLPGIITSFLYLLQRILFIYGQYFKPVDYFLTLTAKDFFILLLFLELLLLILLYVRLTFIVILFTILPYLIVLTYGYLTTFSERHFIQVIILILTILGFAIDKLIRNYGLFQKKIASQLIGITVVIFVALIARSAVALSVTLLSDINNRSLQVGYLTEVGKFLPDNAIIIVGMKHENVFWIYNYTKKTVAYNIKNTPLLLPYTNAHFHIPFTAAIYPQYDINDVFNEDFDIAAIVADPDKFRNYQFYILDYDASRWRVVLTAKNQGVRISHFGSETLMLKEVFKTSQGRSVYQLVPKL